MQEVGFTSSGSKWQVFKGANRYYLAHKAKQAGREYFRVGEYMFIEKCKLNGRYFSTFPLAA